MEDPSLRHALHFLRPTTLLPAGDRAPPLLHCFWNLHTAHTVYEQRGFDAHKHPSCRLRSQLLTYMRPSLWTETNHQCVLPSHFAAGYKKNTAFLVLLTCYFPSLLKSGGAHFLFDTEIWVACTFSTRTHKLWSTCVIIFFRLKSSITNPAYFSDASSGHIGELRFLFVSLGSILRCCPLYFPQNQPFSLFITTRYEPTRLLTCSPIFNFTARCVAHSTLWTPGLARSRIVFL